MRTAIRRLARLEKKREDRRCELWILFEDGRVQELGSDEPKWHHELSDSDPGVVRLFISPADARA
jgi:hypothetical protein